MAEYFEGIGRRKEASARVRLSSGSGKFTVNEKSLEEYFTRQGDPEAIRQPFSATGQEPSTFDVSVLVTPQPFTSTEITMSMGLIPIRANG